MMVYNPSTRELETADPWGFLASLLDKLQTRGKPCLRKEKRQAEFKVQLVVCLPTMQEAGCETEAAGSLSLKPATYMANSRPVRLHKEPTTL